MLIQTCHNNGCNEYDEFVYIIDFVKDKFPIAVISTEKKMI